MTVKFKYAILYVEDVEFTLEFYEKAFGLSRCLLHESGDYGELDTGVTILAFASRSLTEKLGKSPSNALPDAPTFEIAFETDDVAGALQKAIEAGAKLSQEVRYQSWGQETAYVSDPNGFLIELCSPVFKT